MNEAPSILARDDGATIAYRRRAGRSPGVLFLTGFNSDMTGAKAGALDAFCAENGRAFLRFDYFAHGASSGDFAQATIGRFLDDALAVVDRLTKGELVLVGSSIGGWLMLLVARARPERIRGLVGIAAAPDATEDLMWQRMSFEQRETLMLQGAVRVPSRYSEAGYLITRKLIEEARAHLVMRKPLEIRCPVRLMHGMADPDVPWHTSLTLADHLPGDDVQLLLVKDGDHRLSRASDLDLLVRTVKPLLD
ncbi:MAG TPA: alpha/beta hydrolase [Stellaceae bacterium]|nr:alpha/beta hydrolase [Stellaceae bacterium]